MPVDYMRPIDDIFKQFEGPKFTVVFWNSSKRTYGRGKKSNFTMILTSPSTVRRILSQGSIGFGEAYMDGSLQITGDIQSYLRMRHQFKHFRRSPQLIGTALVSKLSQPKLRQKNIKFHYDTGNEFFARILDKTTMSYSAGRFEKKSDSLDKAQQQKLDLVCNWIDKPKAASILDLGSGWGGFAEYGAKKHGWKITGYTYSKAQFDYCKQLVKDSGLNRQVSFEFKDMVSQLPDKKYDAIVMIESFEHVGESKLSSHFQHLYDRLKPGGSLYIQTSGHYKKTSPDKFILKYVFPGGYLPTLDELIAASSKAGFVIGNLRDDTNDYLQTLPIWIENLEKNKSKIVNQYGEPFFKLWELWMNGAKVGFEVNYVNLFRINLIKPLN